MLTSRELQSIIDNKIRDLEFDIHPSELLDPIKYTLRMGGKRLRPVLCLMACELFGGDYKKALGPAIGVEIFHNFTLLHDDIMDEAPIRRGKPTVYKKWNPNIAILSGDTMMALAYEYIMNAPKEIRNEVFSIFNKTAIEVCEGQQYDMNFETQANVEIPDYMEMIRLKTAVLLAGSLKIGAVIGGASATDAEKIYSFGTKIGIAFQLKDDLLDVFSDEDKFGKLKGGDIVTNKKTYLYIKAFELADPSDNKKLTANFRQEFNDPGEKIKAVKKIYEDLNIEQITLDEISNYYIQANQLLDTIAVDSSRKSELKLFTEKLMEREN